MGTIWNDGRARDYVLRCGRFPIFTVRGTGKFRHAQIMGSDGYPKVWAPPDSTCLERGNHPDQTM